MLTSRNPNGEIEVYTDIGQFIGILPEDYPGVREFATDGGPGSGNFGHKGRPGKVGGSSEKGSPAGYSEYKSMFGSSARRMMGALERFGVEFGSEDPSDEEWMRAEEEALGKGKAEALFGTYFSVKAIESDWYEKIKSGKFEHLEPEEAEFILRLQDGQEGEDPEEKEYGVIYSDMSEDEKKAYLSAMSKEMAGGFVQDIIDKVVGSAKGSNFEKTVDKIRASHKEGTPWTEKELREAGKSLYDEHQKAIKDFKKSKVYLEAETAWKDSVEKYGGAREELLNAKEELSRMSPGSGEYKAQEKKVKKLQTALKKAAEERDSAIKERYFVQMNSHAIALSQTLGKVRRMGADAGHLESAVIADKGMGTARKVFMKAIGLLPNDWLVHSLSKGRVEISSIAGSGYSRENHFIARGNSFIGLSRNADAGDGRYIGICIHEFVHRLENTEPELLRIEKEFYERRTKGEQEDSLRKLCPGHGYDVDEYAKKDSFVDPYVGKVYDDDSYEVMTCGIQWAFTAPVKLKKDPEYAEFVYGVLAML